MKTSRNEIAEAINKRKLVLFETVPMTFEVSELSNFLGSKCDFLWTWTTFGKSS